jgi:hypothetical protein
MHPKCCSLSVDFKAKLSILSSQEANLIAVAMQRALGDWRVVLSQIADSQDCESASLSAATVGVRSGICRNELTHQGSFTKALTQRFENGGGSKEFRD